MRRHALFFLLFCILSISVPGQKNEQVLPEKTRILFLLDGSGSMLAKWGDDLRIRQAKRILSDLIDSLRVNQDLELALRAYGHLHDRKLQNCRDTRLEEPFARNNHDRIIEKLNDVRPKGTTPIAFSLQQAAKDFPENDNYRNIVIIITDGIESCDGDPCQVSLELQKKGIFLKPFVIGLGMSTDYSKQFDCLGEYFDAKETSDFQNVLNKALTQTLDKTTVSVELLDVNNKPKETDVNVTFYDNFTNLPVYEFVHYRDQNGKPDSVEIDAVRSYDIVVNTVPQVISRDIRLEGGKHNVITIKSPQGSLKVNQAGSSEYGYPVDVIVRKHKNYRTLNIQKMGKEEKLLVGRYDLEILTLPRIYIENTRIEQSKLNLIDIPPPGLINIQSNSAGIGSIYQVNKSTRELWTANLPDKENTMTLAMQPGKYKLVFRAINAHGSKFTQIREFTVRSGATSTINLVNY